MEKFKVIIGLAILTTLLGLIIPRVVIEALPADYYYHFTDPVVLEEGVYAPCSDTIAHTLRFSRISQSATAYRELYLISEDQEVYRVVTPLAVQLTEESGQRLKLVFALPCDIPEGTYRWQGIMEFDVKGVKKSYAWKSTTFNVVNLSKE